MLSRKKQGKNAALLSAAATALTVKAALMGPIAHGQPRLAAAVEPAPAILGDETRIRPDHPYSRALVRKILGGQLAEALREPEGPTTAEVSELASRSLEHHLERRLRSLTVLDRS